MVLKNLSRAIQDPYLVRNRIRYEISRSKGMIPHDLGIQGSYNSGNVGDRSIGELLKQRAKAKGYRTFLFDKNIKDSNARVHILAGGGVIHDWYGVDHLNGRLEYIRDGGLLLGVGVPGLRQERARRIVREKLQSVDTVTVRDRRSKRRLQTAYDGDIEVTACPAILYQDPNKDSIGRTGVNFVPCFDKSADVLSYYFGYDEDICVEDAMDAYVENAQSLVNKIKNPIFIPFHRDDVEFANRYLDIDVLQYTPSVTETLNRISRVDRMITSRFHSLVFSLACDKPVLPIAYAPKVSSLADRVGIDSYRPHEHVPLTFQNPNNLDSVREAAYRNIKLLFDRLDK